MNKFLAAVAATAGLLTSTAALAVPSQCGLGTLTATYADASTASYLDCTGAWDGNIAANTAVEIEQIIAIEFGLSPAPYIGESNNANNPWTNDPGAVNSGVLTFANPYGGLFVVGLHGGDQNAPVYPNIPVPGGGLFSLYLFDGTIGGGIVSIAFDTVGVFVNDAGAGRNLSHATLYAGDEPGQVPEPTTLGLLLAGVAAAGAARRRRN